MKKGCHYYVKYPVKLLAQCILGVFIATASLYGDTPNSADLPIPPKVALVAPPKAAPFAPHQVRLLDGTFKQGQDTDIEYLLSLEPDRFLANFRKEAGLKPKAQSYSGWETMGIAGHSLGHYLSACSYAYAVSGNTQILERVKYIVSELAECQKANGDGYVAAIPEGRRVFKEVSSGNIRSAGFDLNGVWVPNYTIHKLMAGLRDAYHLCGIHDALQVEIKLADWLETVYGHLTEEQMQKVLACEHGGMNEVLADLYADTGADKYLKLSYKFHHKAILDPLSRGEDILAGKHANTQIPKLIGLARRYEITGDNKDRETAEFFWQRVVYHHSYVTGGNGDHEYFGQPDKLNDRLSVDTTETCNVYNMLKLTRHVFGWRPETTVADFYERALLNHIRATQHPDGRLVYNLTLLPGGHKVYQTKYDSFTCCVGTGMENHVRYNDAIYFHNLDTLWINLFIASELNWQDKGITLRQETMWPFSDTSRLVIKSSKPQNLTLKIRVPFWSKQNFEARVSSSSNADHSVYKNPDPDGFISITRTWKDGDEVFVKFPMSIRTESMPDNPKRIAIFYGPTLLAADLGPENDPAASQPDFVPVLVTDDRPAESWIVMDEKLSTIKTVGVGRPRDVQLKPFFNLHNRRYTVFFDIYTQSEWEKRQEEIRQQREREQKLALRTVDLLRIGEMQPERDHNLKGENTFAGEAMGRKWRHAVNGGWFSCDMKVLSNTSNVLVCTYWGSDAGNRVFDILADDTLIATQRLQNNKPGQFFDVEYLIPPEITKDKEKITIKFKAHQGAIAGGVYSVRILKSE